MDALARVVEYPVCPCPDPERCKTSPAAAADCFEHRWDEALSPLVTEPASAMTDTECESLAQDPSAPQRLLREFYHLDVESASRHLVLNPATPRDVLDRIRSYASAGIRMRMLAGPHVDINVVTKILGRGSGHEAVFAASNLALTEDTIEQAVRRGTDPVRLAALRNPSCPVDLLREFAYDLDADTRYAVARNVTTPDEVRANMVDDPEGEVRSAVGMSTASPELMASVVHERSEKVRLGAAYNPRLSLSLLWEVLHGNGDAINYTPLVVAEHPRADSDLIMAAMRVVDNWGDVDAGDDDAVEALCEVEDALEQRAVVWMRRERSIAWDDIAGIDDLIDTDLTL